MTSGKLRAFISSIKYRHPLTLAVAATATACILIVIVVASWKAYANRAMRKHYPSISLPAIGIKASLRTERVGDSVEYVFYVKPTSEAVQGRLNEVIHKRDRDSLRFFVTLEDDDGFELCETRASWTPDVDNQGNITELRGNGALADCPISRYARAHKWTINFAYPLISENLSPESPQIKPQETAKEAQPNNEQEKQKSEPTINSTFATEDTLTGADPMSGEIETLSGRSFRVTREAEKATLVLWMAPNKVTVSCDHGACVVTNNDHSQSVHARLMR